MSNDARVIVALDYPAVAPALEFVSKVNPEQCKLKVGKELFTRAGPQFVETLVSRGFDVFLDLKFHDIPNTVAAACRVACELGVWMLNVHALGGREMMSAAKEAVAKSSYQPRLIAVTILTSMNEVALKEVGLAGTPKEHVLSLAILAQQSGLDGVVCSAQEAHMLRDRLGPEFQLVTPGIRPANADAGDQKRIMTPADAIKNGATFLVVGRPITQAGDPTAVLRQISQEIEQVTSAMM
ncbi:MAG: orotidine-5'-phosphate decarboxylase [Gammaproteobacteria bacterium]|nr:orotidine-5'-phosphate decarboxylase [Gammaproteobacteria bacterium]